MVDPNMSKHNAGSAQEITRLGYTEETRNLNFRVECADLEDLMECVKIIDAYNEFDHDRVNKALGGLAKYKAFYNEGNQNNGHSLFTFSIGREGSPVMYIAYNGSNFHHKELSLDEHKKVMEAFGRESLSDEVNETTEWSHEYRFWWD